MRKVRVEVTDDLKEGDIIFIYYGRPRVYMTKVERVIDGGKAVITGKGGHASRTEVKDVSARVLSDIPKYQGIGADAEQLKKALEEGTTVEVENGVDYYNRLYNMKVGVK